MPQMEAIILKKNLLSDDDWATIEFIMNKTITNYEKNNKDNVE